MFLLNLLGAMFVLHSEQLPHTTSEDFRQANHECNDGRVLNVMSIYGVEDPVEAKDGVNHDRSVVPPGVFEAESIS